jgi:hypothetical protein
LADLLDGLARHLVAVGLVDYDPDGVTGNTFMEAMPPTPDEAIVLTLYGGPQPDSRLPYDPPNLQVRVRGTSDPRISRTLANALYNELQGLGPIQLPDGTELLSCNSIQTVTSMGLDDQRRFEHVVNFNLEVEAPTAHRP